MLPKIIILALIAVHYTVADDVKAYSDVVYQASGAQYLRWSVEVYQYTDGVPEHTCGGSLVKPAVVISAARCFWANGEQQPASRFAVARSWGGILFDTEWHALQKSEVRTIHLPPSFRDRAGLYADDIAVLTLATPLRGVRPICVSFDEDLDRQQLAEGNFGRNMGTLQNAGYGLPSPLFTALEVRYATRERCANESEPYHREQLTSDKICVGFKQSLQGLCHSDHGGGLAFYSGTSYAAIPYLRGVASTPFPDPSEPYGTYSSCSTFRYAAFTHIASQRAFLERHVPGLEATCGQHYATADVGDNTTAGVGDYFECNCFCNNKTIT